MVQVAGAWSDPGHIEMLTSQWAKGISATDIAKALANAFPGARYSRSAILGKIHRLGLSKSGREVASKPMAAPRAPAVKRAASQNNGLAFTTRKFGIAGRGTVFAEADARPPRAVVAAVVEPAGLRTVLTIGRCECRWPIGEPADDAFTFCGRAAEEGAYCPDHRKRAFTSERTRQWVDKKLMAPPRGRFGT